MKTLFTPLLIALALCLTLTRIQLRTLPAARRRLSPLASFINEFTSRMHLGPLAQVTTTLVLVGMTSWIARHPDSPVWQEITGTPSSSRRVMLTSATALLALLVFTVTSGASVARDRDGASTTTYLGQSEHDYLVTRSSVAGVLRLPFFPILVVFLFAIPVVEPLLTHSLTWTPTHPPVKDLVGTIGITIPVRLLLLSLWCSCFAIVATSLLLNLTMMLRTTMVRLLSPTDVRRRIKQDLDNQYIQSLQRVRLYHYRGQNEQERQLATWVISFLHRTGASEDHATLNDAVSATLQSSRASQITDKDDEHWGNITKKLRISRRRRDSTGIRARILELTDRYQNTLLQRQWHMMKNLASGRRQAFINYLGRPDQEPRVHRIVLSEALLDCNIVDHRVYVLLRDQGTNTDIDDTSPVTELFHDVLTDPQRLPNPRFRTYRWRNEDPLPVSEQVITTVAITYRDLGELLTDRSSPVGAHFTEEDLRMILDHAGHLQHEKTRNYAITQVTDAIIEATITSRHPDETLSADTLSTVVPSLREKRRFAQPPIDTAENTTSRPATYRSTDDLVHEVVLRRLRKSPALDPTARSTLLTLVNDAEILSSLLYALLYADGSNRLNAEVLHPFLPFIQYIYLDEEECDRYAKHAAYLLTHA